MPNYDLIKWYLQLETFFTRKEKYLEKKFQLNSISSFIIFDFSDIFLLNFELNLKNLYLLFES